VGSDRQQRAAPNNWTRNDGHYSRIPLNGRLKVGHVGGTGQPVLIQIQKEAEKQDWIDQRPWIDAQMIRSFAGQPLVFKGEVLGVLGLYTRAHITEEEFAPRRFAGFADGSADA
jgi:hypothetical protein